MVLMNLGSVADRIYTRIENIPTSISGALVDIADEERLYMEEWLGRSIGSVDIAEKYQPALIALASANTLAAMQLEGTDATRVKLGDFEEDKGGESSLSQAAEAYRKAGEAKLKVLGRRFSFVRVIG